MFCPNIETLAKFYNSPLGKKVSFTINQSVNKIWNNIKQENILSIGFIFPYITSFMNNNNLISAMLPQQGIMHWPSARNNKSFMTDEIYIPIEDNIIDKVIMAHSLEYINNSNEFLKEIWRILVPGGKLMIITPNRQGLWSQFETTPFCYGNPYSSNQIRKLIRKSAFYINKIEYSLFFPPLEEDWSFQFFNFIEPVTSRFLKSFGGVMILEAEKKLYAATYDCNKKSYKKIYMPVTKTV